MLFSSPQFFLFFILYFFNHTLIQKTSTRLCLIVVGSLIFYGYWNVEYAVLPIFLTAIAWSVGLWIDTNGVTKNKVKLAVGIVLILIPLLFFKYTNFIINDVIFAYQNNGVLNQKIVDLALPLGISFITFTLISYLVDVYQKKYPVEQSFSWLLAYILFFPQLIAGPILRPRQLIPQLKSQKKITKREALFGLVIFTFGLVKKLVIADQIAMVIDPIFSQPLEYTTAELWLAVFGFSAQIYCDFSGYTDMAIGLGYVLGVRLPLNFTRPYLAKNISEFWRCWHITLSNWLRDYIYIPLGGNRGAVSYMLRNVLITMLIGGLWHGANWTFIIWGGMHGVFIVLSNLLRGKNNFRFLQVFFTFLVVTLLWVLFRAENIGVAIEIYQGLIDFKEIRFVDLYPYTFVLFLLLVFFATHVFDDVRLHKLLVKRLPIGYVYLLICSLWILAITISTGSSAQFIYFDF